jgi:uncharacterized tellurite resistance protein B-like protein
MKFLQSTDLIPSADELAPLSEDQNLAILECLFLTVLIDGKIEASEVKAFVASALLWPWNWGNEAATLKAKLEVASDALRAVGQEGMQEHLQALGERVPGAALREKTFAGMFALMIADGRLDERERAAALDFARIFAIDPARAKQLVEQVTAARVARA